MQSTFRTDQEDTAAIKKAKKKLAKKPWDLFCLNNLGIAYAAAGKYKEAIKLYDEAYAHCYFNDQKVAIVRNRLHSFLFSNDFESAKKDCSLLETLWTPQKYLDESWGEYYFYTKQYKLAHQRFVNAGLVTTHSLNAAMAYGDYEGALKQSQKLISKNPYDSKSVGLAKEAERIGITKLGNNALEVNIYNDSIEHRLYKQIKDFSDENPNHQHAHELENQLTKVKDKSPEQYIILAIARYKMNLPGAKVEQAIGEFFNLYLPLAIPDCLLTDFSEILVHSKLTLRFFDKSNIAHQFKNHILKIVGKLELKTQLNLRLAGLDSGIYAEILRYSLSRWSTGDEAYLANIDKLLKLKFCLNDIDQDILTRINESKSFKRDFVGNLIELMQLYYQLQMKYKDHDALKSLAQTIILGSGAEVLLTQLLQLQIKLEKKLDVNPQTITFIRGNPVKGTIKKQIEKHIYDEKFDDALALINETLKGDKHDFDAYFLLAQVQRAKKDNEASDEAIENAIGVANTSKAKRQVYFLKGEYLLENNKFNELEKLISILKPYSDTDAKILQADLYYLTLRYKESAGIHKTLGVYNDRYAYAHLLYGDLDIALKAADKLENKALASYIRCIAFAKLGKYSSAYDEARKATLLDDADYLKLRLGVTAYLKGEDRLALDKLLLVKNAEARIWEAKIHEKANEEQKSKSAYTEVLNNKDAHLSLRIYAALKVGEVTKDCENMVEELQKKPYKSAGEWIVLILVALKVHNGKAQETLDQFFRNYLPLAVPLYLKYDFVNLLYNYSFNLNNIPKESKIITKGFKNDILKFVATIDPVQQVKLRIRGITHYGLLGYILRYERYTRASIFWGRLKLNIDELAKLEFCLNDLNVDDSLGLYFNGTAFHDHAHFIDQFMSLRKTYPQSLLLKEFGKKVVHTAKLKELTKELDALKPKITSEKPSEVESVEREVKKDTDPETKAIVEEKETVEVASTQEATLEITQEPIQILQPIESRYQQSIDYAIRHLKKERKELGWDLDQCLYYLNTLKEKHFRLNALIQVLSPVTELGKFFDIKEHPELLVGMNLNDFDPMVLDELSISILSDPDIMALIAPSLYKQYLLQQTRPAIIQVQPSPLVQQSIFAQPQASEPKAQAQSTVEHTDESIAEIYTRFALNNAPAAPSTVPQVTQSSDNRDLIQLEDGPVVACHRPS